MKWVRLVVAGLLFVYASGVVQIPRSKPPIVAPLSEMQTVATPVLKIARTMSIVDRLWLRTIYQSAANVTRRDGEQDEPLMQNTESLREVHVSILKFVWKSLANNEPGKYEGLAEAVSDVITHAVGKENRPLTPDVRERAAEAFEAIAWAGLGEG